MTTPAPEKSKKKVVKKSPNPFLKAWRKLDDWNVGLSGKIMIILIIIGILAKVVQKL